MEIEKQKLVWELALKRISEHEFVLRYGVNFRNDQTQLLGELEQALASRNPNNVEAALILGALFGWPQSSEIVLCRLLEEEWHTRHEDIAFTLQQLHPACAVEPLYRAVTKNLEYLAYDNGAALARKCIYALAAIGTADAKENLVALTNSNVEHVRSYAQRALKALENKIARE
jgi:hypothetical protein